MAIVFQALAAICAAALTLWRPFMRTESRGHKVAHTAIGGLGILFIVIAGYLSSSSQSQLASKLDQLQRGIANIGDKIGASGDAASVLAETAKTLDRLNARVTTLDEQQAYSDVAQLNLLGLKGMALPPLEEHSALSWLLSPYVHWADGTWRWDCTPDALAAYDHAIAINRRFPFAYFFKGDCRMRNNTQTWERDIKAARQILLITTTIVGHHANHDEVLKAIQSGGYGQ